jgi:hypothetical protein
MVIVSPGARRRFCANRHSSEQAAESLKARLLKAAKAD